MAGSGATSSWRPTSQWRSSSLWPSSRGTSCPRRPRSGAPAARSRRDASTAYESAAGAALYPFLRAQFLSDAGRGWLATGDTAKALVAYRMIAEKLDSTNAAGEAKVRIGELTKGGGHP